MSGTKQYLEDLKSVQLLILSILLTNHFAANLFHVVNVLITRLIS